jgi:hypothetical protein
MEPLVLAIISSPQTLPKDVCLHISIGVVTCGEQGWSDYWLGLVKPGFKLRSFAKAS